MTTKERCRGVIEWFAERMPAAESELVYENPYQLLVAVILSAQCTDKRVNLTTPALFEAYPTPQDMARATDREIYGYIRSISYPNNKAKNLAAMARMLCAEFGGEVPADLELLQRLPGVGRKTANVLGAVLWQKQVMPVDTHVFRVSERIGLTTRSKNPLQTERALERLIPGELLPVAHHWLILHGRYVCTARAPKCGDCGIAPWCRKFAADRKAEERRGAETGRSAAASGRGAGVKRQTEEPEAGRTKGPGTEARRTETEVQRTKVQRTKAGRTERGGRRRRTTQQEQEKQ